MYLAPNTKPRTMSYKRFETLSAKLSNKTITKQEKNELFLLAFGEDFMKSKDKGFKKTYQA